MNASTSPARVGEGERRASPESPSRPANAATLKPEARQRRTLTEAQIMSPQGIRLLVRSMHSMAIPRAFRAAVHERRKADRRGARGTDNSECYKRLHDAEAHASPSPAADPPGPEGLEREAAVMALYAQYMGIFADWSKGLCPAMQPEVVLQRLSTRLKKRADLGRFLLDDADFGASGPARLFHGGEAGAGVPEAGDSQDGGGSGRGTTPSDVSFDLSDGSLGPGTPEAGVRTRHTGIHRANAGP